MTVAFAVFILLSVLSAAYGFLILSVGSGTAFFAVWLALSLIFAFVATGIKLKLFLKLKKWVRRMTLVIICIFAVAFVVAECFIVSGFNKNGEEGLDYIIVLGAQVHENSPSTVLKYRLDKAKEYLDNNENTVCIVSGGKGSNELHSEAEIMAKYLIEYGISEERIIKEDKSTNTKENIGNSKAFIKEGASVGIVTNNFHIYRSLAIAKKQGLENTCGISAKTTALYLPNNMLREFFALAKFALFG